MLLLHCVKQNLHIHFEPVVLIPNVEVFVVMILLSLRKTTKIFVFIFKSNENTPFCFNDIFSPVNERCGTEKNKNRKIFGFWIRESPYFQFWKSSLQVPLRKCFTSNHLCLCQQKFKIQISHQQNIYALFL